MTNKIIRLTEEELHSIIKESVNKMLNEMASSLLYHFLSFSSFEKLVETDSFTPTSFERKYVGGKNSLSLSRTKTFREGWPVIMYSGLDGKGDDWCAIRLTVDGDLINRKPNFKHNGKQHNLSVKPFDWAYKEYGDGDPYTFADEQDGIFAQNGKEWMMQSDNDTETYLPINFGKKRKYVNGIGDKQGHPYSQAEDRLTTSANKVPNASSYILRVDILLMPYAFNDYNKEDRETLYDILTNSEIGTKTHVYTNMRNLELGKNELKRYDILLKNGDKYHNPIPFNLTKKQDF